MNATWDAPGAVAAGWVGYDESCPVCTTLARRLRPVMGRRGYEFQPLQGAWMARRLGLNQGRLPGEIQLVLRDGRVLGGTDGLLFLARQVWWMRPLAWLATVPWIRGRIDAGYRWVARNRHCLGDACRFPLRQIGRAHV